MRQLLTKTSVKNKKDFKHEINETILLAPIKLFCQIYLLIAIDFCNTIKINTKNNKNIDRLKQSNNTNINPVRRKITNDILSSALLKNKRTFLSQFK